jgi:PAS domain S-box-containing protein
MLFGAASLQDFAGRSPFDLVHPEDRPIVRERVRQLLAGEVGVNPRIEVRVVGLDGEERTVEANAAAFDDAEGSPSRPSCATSPSTSARPRRCARARSGSTRTSTTRRSP